jgi:GNAT superfamily N-acetyltransferase
MTSPLLFSALGPGEYDRAKRVLNRARHPGFVGRELFFRCATAGQALVATREGADVAVALIVKSKLMALSVVVEAQGQGVGQALVAFAQPRWVNAIGAKLAWFERLGYSPVGAPRVGQNGKHATQLMERTGEPIQAPRTEGEPIQAPRTEGEPIQAPPATQLESEDPEEAGVVIDVRESATLRERAEEVLITIAEAPNPGRSAMARVAAARTILDLTAAPVMVGGWAPITTTPELEDHQDERPARWDD